MSDVEHFLEMLKRMRNNPTLNKVIPQLGEYYTKDCGARFVLEYASRFPDDVINKIKFEDMVKVFDQFGDETKRIYDFTVGIKKYELKAWTKWAHWSDDAFLNQFVKDISSIDNLNNLQWVFQKTTDITQESLHEYVIKALSSNKGRNMLANLKIDKVKKILNFTDKLLKPEEMVNNILRYFDNVEKFNAIFKVIE